MARFHIEAHAVTGEVTQVPYTPDEEAKADAREAVALAEAPRKALEAQLAAVWATVSLDDWALAQTDDAGGTQAGRDAMAAKMAQIATLKAQLAAM